MQKYIVKKSADAQVLNLPLVKNREGSEILPYLQATTLASRSFRDADGRHRTVGPQAIYYSCNSSQNAALVSFPQSVPTVQHAGNPVGPGGSLAGREP